MGVEENSIGCIDFEEIHSKQALLLQFNERDPKAFGRLYLHFFDELHYYAKRLFQNTEHAPADIVQDVFMVIWGKKELCFSSPVHLKNYLYLSIKNRYKDYLKHRLHNRKYIEEIKYYEEEAFTYQVESELFSLLSAADHFLPRECARMLKLYLQGYNIQEIAGQLGKSPSTVYHQHAKAIEILSKHLSDKNLKILIFLLFG